MKIENLKVGKLYYLEKGQFNCVPVELLEIIDDKKALVKSKSKSGKVFECRVSKLHRRPEQAVVGGKSKERVIRQEKERRQKEEESLINNKTLQSKVKRLGHSTYATMEKEKYIVKNFVPFNGENTKPKFDTLEQLEKWVDGKYIELQERIAYIREKRKEDYKYLKCKNHIYKIINFNFTSFVVQCKRSDKQNKEVLFSDLVLKKEDIPEFKIKICR